MLKIDKGNGTATLTGIRDALRVIDAKARDAARHTKSEAYMPLGDNMHVNFGAKNAAITVQEVTARDSAWQRDHLGPYYDALNTALFAGKKGERFARVLREGRELKPDVALQRHRPEVPALLSEVQKTLHDTVAKHDAQRVQPAKAAIRAALALEPVKDAGEGAARAVQMMEVRSRLNAMPHGERVQAVLRLGREGNLLSLAAVRDDPLRAQIVPHAVLAEAESAAVVAQGGQFLLDDLADAQAEAAHLSALAKTAFGALLSEAKDAGISQSLLTPWVVDAADKAVNNNAAEPEEVEG